MLSVNLVALGAWGDGFASWSDLENLLVNNSVDGADTVAAGPKPDIIPANERRRAPLPVRLAVETSWQATQAAGMNPQELSCVFVSSYGDTQLTDYMCKELASENKQLSPTKFHNSVHNAAAGYWTISTGCVKAANSVAGFAESISLALMEAVIQCNFEQQPMLITFFDAPVTQVLQNVLGEGSIFAISMVILPDHCSPPDSHLLQLTLNDVPAVWPDFHGNDILMRHYHVNHSARLLPLLKILAYSKEKETELTFPLSQARSLSINLSRNK
jgi:hypothetical protein